MLNTFYVEFPTYRYNEDVKALALKAGVKIVDARFQGDNKQCDDAPKLTLKSEYKPKVKHKAKPKPKEAENPSD